MENEQQTKPKSSFNSNLKYFIPAAILLVLGLGYLFTSKSTSPLPINSTPSTTVTMIMKDDTYQPQNLEIKKGTKVIFKNETSEPKWPASNIHPTHGIYPEFDPREPVPSGSVWSFVFDKVGKWKYHDHLVPLIRGEITVSP